MLYVEAKSKANHPQDADMAPIGNEFDVYLSALGFMPVDDPGAASAMAAAGGPGANPGALAASPPTSATGGPGEGATFPGNANAMQTNQLGDWFSGNRYMMGLLEEDLSQFHPHNTWNSGV